MPGYGCGPLCRAGLTYAGQGMQSGDPEDKHVFLRYFSANGREPVLRNGSFVELGALDGVQMSNTHWFERTLGWRGLLVEPDRALFSRLQHNRGLEGNTLVNALCCSRELAGHNLSFVHGGALGQVSEIAPDSLRARPLTRRDVPCMTMASMLVRAGLSQNINFFSLDVQGFEEEVLRSIDWAATSIDVLVVELDGSNQSKDTRVRALLTANGMRFERRMGFGHANDLWLGASFARRAAAKFDRTRNTTL